MVWALPWALVGEALGKKDAEDARILAAQGLAYSFIASLILIVPGLLFGGALIELTSEPGNYRLAGTRYFYILLLSTPGFLVGYTCNGILQAQGDSVSMQRALIATFFANIALNPLLIYGIPGIVSGMGFDGIATATVISQTGVLAFLITRVFAKGRIGRNLADQRYIRVRTFGLPLRSNGSSSYLTEVGSYHDPVGVQSRPSV